jgi:hypothetical protein
MQVALVKENKKGQKRGSVHKKHAYVRSASCASCTLLLWGPTFNHMIIREPCEKYITKIEN